MRVPARCNRRSCQARRNLSKRPELYRSHPKCHVSGCSGLMYVDEYRLRKGAKDHPPVCKNDCYPWPHRVDSPNCRQREDWLLDKAFAPVSRHAPWPAEVLEVAPF